MIRYLFASLIFAFWLMFFSFDTKAQCPIFYDGFESGSFSPNWSVGSSLTSTGVSTTNVAEGDYSLTGTGGDQQHLNGYSSNFLNITPSEVSWYMYTNDAGLSVNYFVVGDESMNASSNIFFCYFRGADSEIRFVSNPDNFEVQVTPDSWYFIEVKNIDWTNKTIDIYIDGVLQISNFPFRSPSMNYISEVHLYNFHDGVAYWDEITIGLPDTEAPVPDEVALDPVQSSCEVLSITAPTATDNCAGSITGTPDVSFPLTASTTIIWTYDDGSGNISTQTQEVEIVDNEAPIPDETNLDAIEEKCQLTSLTAPNATDNCDGSIEGVHSASLPITEDTEITWTFTDAAGNTSTQTQSIIINEVDASVNFDGTNITAQNTGSGVTYQWIDCNNNFSQIPGETNSIFTPSQGGSYAVIVTEDDCEETSDCIQVDIANLSEESIALDLIIYPNPSNGIFELKANQKIVNYSVFDTQGRIVKTEEVDDKYFFIDLSTQVNGVYYLKANGLTKKLIIRK